MPAQGLFLLGIVQDTRQGRGEMGEGWWKEREEEERDDWLAEGSGKVGRKRNRNITKKRNEKEYSRYKERHEKN